MQANTMVLWYHYSRHAIDGFKGHRNGSTMLNHLPKKVFLSCVYVLKLNLKLNPAICHQVKMLRVLEKARPKCAIEISSTFCGAHSVPKGSTAAQVCSHHVYFYSKNTFLHPQGKHRDPGWFSLYNRLEGNLIHSGDHRCDRETTPSSFEAEKGRSVLTSPLG